MMDKGKILQAQELLKDSGATTVVLIVNDGDYQSALLNGMGIDIVKALLGNVVQIVFDMQNAHDIVRIPVIDRYP